MKKTMEYYEMEHNKKINVAIVGVGNIAQYQMKALALNDNFQLLAGCDINEEKRHSLPDGCSFYNDTNSMTKNEEIDLIIISTPNQYHKNVFSEISNNVPYVFIEKPISHSYNEFLSFEDIAKQSKSLVNISYHAMFAKDLQWFLLEYNRRYKKEFGEINFLQLNFFDPYIVDGRLLDCANSLNGSWIDSGINALSVLSQLIDISSVVVHDQSHTKLPQYNCDSIASSMSLTFSINGSSKKGNALINTSWALGLNYKSTRIGFSNTDKQVILDHSRQTVVLLDGGMNEIKLADFSQTNERLLNHYAGVFEHLLESIENNQSNLALSCSLHEILFSKSNYI